MPVCRCCPNFISPGVERCENCATPVGDLIKCPNCYSEILEGSSQCRHCGYYISDDGREASEYEFSDNDWSASDEDDDEYSDENDRDDDLF